MIKHLTFIILFVTAFSVKCFGQSSIAYTIPGPFIVGTAIPVISPILTAAAPASYSISPAALSAGLIFHPNTGVIDGTPGATAAATTYTITATITGAPSLTTTINIVVNDPPPPVVSYPSPNTFPVNSEIPALLPTATGTPVSSYSIEPGTPALPAGIVLDPGTGKISGHTSTVSTATNYSIRAESGIRDQNGSIRSVASVTITFNDPSAPSISYATANVFTYDTAIPTLAPAIKGGTVTHYAVTPDLPNGLTLDPGTGVITGTPRVVSGNTNYVVTGHTAAGDRFTNIGIAVIPALPSNLYQPSIVQGTVDVPITSMKPVLKLNNSIYSVETVPPLVNTWTQRRKLREATRLPDGLRLNSATGEISGKPTKAYPPTRYTIVATDISGQQTRYTVNIAVDPLPDTISMPATISFVGQGDIQQSLNTGAKIAANTGIGVVFRENSRVTYGILHDIEIDFSINIASTVDTIKSVNSRHQNAKNAQDFGNSVLLPLNSGQAFSFNFKGYFTTKSGLNGNYRRNQSPQSLGGVLSGFNISLAGSNRNWQYNDTLGTGTTPNATLVKTSLLSFYAGPFFEFITPKKENNYGKNVSITLGAGYSARWILGDVQQKGMVETRSHLLNGSTANSFNGAEVILALRFYNIKAEVHLPFFTSKDNIPGLSGTHLTTFIGFSGGFPIDLKKTVSP